MEYNKETLVPLATKYLDRVELKGIQEVNEFTYLANFFSEIQKGTLKVVVETSPED